MAGKGSRQRPTDIKRFEDNWERIFSTKKVQAEPTLSPEPGMSTASLEHYQPSRNAHAEGSEAPNE